jgi:hypothetical protein
MNSAVRDQEPRQLSDAEREMLDLMLSPAAPGVEALRVQARSATVSGQCGCGCPSIRLQPRGLAPRATLPFSPLPWTGETDAPPGESSLRVVLFVADGWIRYLELLYQSSAAPTQWPGTDRITLRHT